MYIKCIDNNILLWLFIAYLNLAVSWCFTTLFGTQIHMCDIFYSKTIDLPPHLPIACMNISIAHVNKRNSGKQ